MCLVCHWTQDFLSGLYSGLLCTIVPRAGMGALHSGLGFPWLSPPCHPVMRGSDLKATLEKVGPMRPVALMLQSSVPLQHFPFLFFFLLLIQLKFFLVSFRENLYCEVNNDLGVPTFRNMFNTLFKHWQIIWNKDKNSSEYKLQLVTGFQKSPLLFFYLSKIHMIWN